MKVFVLGRPGSGKSTATHLIAEYARRKGFSTIRINDYDILQEMFQADPYRTRFYPTAFGGFDVRDFSVLDDALREIEGKVPASTGDKLITIEFARNDYGEALKLFRRDFLQDAHFLFLDTDVETCIQRVHERTAHPTTADDHFVSDDIIRYYYHKDNKQYIASHLKADFGINKRVEIIDNIGSWQHCIKKINAFVKVILEQEAANLREFGNGVPALVPAGALIV